MVKPWPLLLLAVLLLGSVPVIERPVTDQRDLLTPAEEELVASSLEQLRIQTGAQMAVLLVGTTGGEPIEDFAQAVAEAWKGGRGGGADDGLLFVLALDDRRMRLEVGYGLEDHLPDDTVRRLLDAQGPLMRQKNYAGAVLGVIKGVRARLPAGSGASWSPGAAPWSLDKVVEVLFCLMAAGIVVGMLLGGSLTTWRKQLGPSRLAAAVGSLLLGPPVLIFLCVDTSQPSARDLLLFYGAYATVFLVCTLLFTLRWTTGLGATLMCATLLASMGVLFFQKPSLFVLEMLETAATVSGVLWGGLAVLWLILGPMSNKLNSIVIFESSPSGSRGASSSSSSSRNTSSSWGASSYSSGRSSSDSSSSRSSSSDSSSSRSSSSRSSSSDSSSSRSSSSDSSWKGGGGRFGGGGASSSW
ncbi:hypothetical protein BO221_29180 [Archangium sp. Cb G35]|uniref:TPM domain-containing protein n=1 Tax=Archangium sp. Cb G35 TaxID=1920190 RepID=UPI00093666F8|nr:TPM domain-containing protein [Archangium sp. Cb G35]OJT20967.1 hypothetical protein BO221_29180 [Archangium sp. Cb G35]